MLMFACVKLEEMLQFLQNIKLNNQKKMKSSISAVNIEMQDADLLFNDKCGHT